jgi:hypothetical protein
MVHWKSLRRRFEHVRFSVDMSDNTGGSGGMSRGRVASTIVTCAFLTITGENEGRGIHLTAMNHPEAKILAIFITYVSKSKCPSSASRETS